MNPRVQLGKTSRERFVAFGVFIHRSDSIYEDSPAERYQFPGQYLARVKACIGDWIIYYEPRKAQESRGYFAIAKIQQVIPDPSTAGMYVAIIEPNSYLDFVNAVPFRDAEGLVERGLLNDEGKISGRAQSAVRFLRQTSFESPSSASPRTALCCHASMRQLCRACKSNNPPSSTS